MLRRRLAAILRRLAEYAQWNDDNPPPPVDALIATILSQNTSDLNSDRAFRHLVASFDSWDAVADASPQELERVIRVAGLARQKTATIQTALRALRTRYGSLDLAAFNARDDDDLIDELTGINGIGLKTAACVLMFSLGRDLCAVDTHIHRVANRLGLVSTTGPDATFRELRGGTPPGRARDLHVALIRFGRHVCKAQRPHCFECPLYDLCVWPEKAAHAAAGKPGAKPVSGNTVLSDVVRGGKG